MNQTSMELETENSNLTAKRKIDFKLASVSAILFLISFLMIDAAFSSYLKGVMALQYKQTDAKVVSVEEHFDPLGISKVAKMRFWINTQEKTALSQIPAGRVMKPGELTVLFYDTNKPENAVLTQEIDYDPIIPSGAFGFFILCFAVFICVKAKK